MPEINLFNGGINTHKDSLKLNPNECISITNANVSSGSIVSTQKPTTVYRGAGSVITEFNRELYSDDGPYMSFAQQQGRLFKVDGETPVYTIGSEDSNGNKIWVPMGLPAPDVELDVKILSNINVTYTAQDPAVFPGVSQGSTGYEYLFIADGVTYQSVLNTAANEGCTSFEIDASAVGATTLKCYRKLGSHLYRINATDTEMVFKDFQKDLSAIQTGTARRAVIMNDLVQGGVGMVWPGNASVKLRALAAGGSENGTLNLDFITGTVTGDAQTISQLSIREQVGLGNLTKVWFDI